MWDVPRNRVIIPLQVLKLTMTGVKRRPLSARRSFVCPRETNFLLVPVNVGRAAVKLGDERLY